MLDFRTETFITLCKTLNYTKAAEQLNITQPAVSQHIRFLESKYNTKLFEQNGKKINITKNGCLIFDMLMTMKHDEKHMLKIIEEEKAGNKKLNFGVTLTVGGYVIAEKTSEFIKKHPEISINMKVENTTQLLNELDNGEIEFAIVEGNFAKNLYDHRLFKKEGFIAVCCPDYQFKKDEIKIIDDLLGEKIIIREVGSGNRIIFESFLMGKNLSLNEFKGIIETSDINAMKTITKSGCGISFLYEDAVKNELVNGELIKIELEDFKIIHDLTFIWKKGSVFSDYYLSIFNELKS